MQGFCDPAALVRQLKWRYATKQFDPDRHIPAEHWAALEAALLLSPSSFGLQPWRFVVVTDPATKARLPAISWNQAQVRDASHVVVFAVRRGINAADVDRLRDRTVEVRRASAESLEGYRQMPDGLVRVLGLKLKQ